MAYSHLQRRQQRYFHLSSQLAQLDNAYLRSLFDTHAAQVGWGINHHIALGRSQVFVKRIPVTSVEYGPHVLHQKYL